MKLHGRGFMIQALLILNIGKFQDTHSTPYTLYNTESGLNPCQEGELQRADQKEIGGLRGVIHVWGREQGAYPCLGRRGGGFEEL